VQLLVYTTVGLVAYLVAYALGLGPPVCALIFLTILTIGVIRRAADPIVSWLRG